VREHNRFDLQIEVIEIDPEGELVQFHVRPDTGRYEWRDRDGEQVLYDRFDNVYFPRRLVIDMINEAMQLTPGPELGVIPDIDEYVAARRPEIASALRSKRTTGQPVDLAEAQLRAFEKDELAFVILSVDIEGSTMLQTSTDRQTFAATVNALLTEIAELIARFHGHVLKYTGDGLIAYFAPPTFIIKNDAAVDSAFCGRRLVYEAINRELEAIGLPPIEVRLGLDAGEAAIVVLGSDKTKRHADLIGDAISLARKIESRVTSHSVV